MAERFYASGVAISVLCVSVLFGTGCARRRAVIQTPAIVPIRQQEEQGPSRAPIFIQGHVNKDALLKQIVLPAEYEIVAHGVEENDEAGGWRLPGYTVIRTKQERFVWEEEKLVKQEKPAHIAYGPVKKPKQAKNIPVFQGARVRIEILDKRIDLEGLKAVRIVTGIFPQEGMCVFAPYHGKEDAFVRVLKHYGQRDAKVSRAIFRAISTQPQETANKEETKRQQPTRRRRL